MTKTAEDRLSRLKAARQEVFDYARLFEDCVVSLDDKDMAFSPSTTSRRTESGRGLDGGRGRGRRRTVVGHRSASVPEAVDERRRPRGPEFDYFSADDKPPRLPKRSRRRDTASMAPPDAPDTTRGERAAAGPTMSSRVYRRWLATQLELKERFYARHLLVLVDIGAAEAALEQDEAVSLTPEPLNVGSRRRRRLGEVVMHALGGASPVEHCEGWA